MAWRYSFNDDRTINMSKYLFIFIINCSYLINLTYSTVNLNPVITTSGAASSCQAGEFKCNSSQCIAATSLCDGFNDCNDNSDETICPIRCSPLQFQCGQFNCIPREQVCDGQIQCYDGSDEEKCLFNCTSTEFKCANSRCIQKELMCNGRQDCDDGSDEQNCPAVSTFDCNRDEFTCNSTKLCVNYWLLCNGVKDCQNGEDEIDCAYRAKEAEAPNYWELAAWVGGSIAIVILIICLVFTVKSVMNKSQNMYG